MEATIGHVVVHGDHESSDSEDVGMMSAVSTDDDERGYDERGYDDDDRISDVRDAPVPPPPPPSPSGRNRGPVRIHVAVPIGDGVDLMLAAALLATFEMHDAALMAEQAGELYDWHTDALEGIFGCYGILERTDERKPYLLCGIPHEGFSETDILRARESLGAWGRELEVVYSDLRPLRTTGDVGLDNLRSHAAHLGLALPRDATYSIGKLVDKHAPRPKSATGEPYDDGMANLRRAESTLSINYTARACKRLRLGDFRPMRV